MKRTALLLVTLLFCSAISVFAGDKDKNKTTEMTGWICNAKCVDQSSDKATCNANCSETGGKVVFISDEGKVLEIANQDKAQPMSGKKCKLEAKKDPDTGELDVQNIVETRGP